MNDNLFHILCALAIAYMTLSTVLEFILSMN